MTRILTEEILKREAKRGFERFSSFLYSLECYTTLETKYSIILDEFFSASNERQKEIWKNLYSSFSK